MLANTAPAAFAAAVAAYPQHLAMIAEDGRQWTYAELDAARLHTAGALLASGVDHGDRVAIWAQNHAQWVILGLALHSLGAPIVPINTRMRGAEAAYILEASGARLLFCAGDFLNQHYPSLLGEHRPASLHEIIVMTDARPEDLSWEAFHQPAEKIDAAAVHQRSAALTPDDCLDILFTSGTTGKPKGVVTAHGQNLKVIREWCERMQLHPQDRYLIANPFFHAFGYKVGWLGGLISGCTILPQAVFDAGQIIARIDREKVSVLPGPPTLFISLLDDPALAAGGFDSLRATITGAAAVAPSLIERIRRELGFDIVLTGYGLTETCGIVALCAADDDAQTIVRSCGKAVPEVELKIVDAQGNSLPAGEPGEVLVRGYNVMQEYLDNPAATAEAIDPDGWLHTGDIGTLDARGYLAITDRLKDMYICGGFNVYPAEIENLIAAHPQIAQVAIIGIPDQRLGEVGKAFIVPRAGASIDPAAIISWCREHIANYKVPREVVTIAALPMNASGKVQKFALR